ncbi:N-acetylmuramoyl-L-alanine amidase CwlD [Priestia koreensis]|uniref:N-acetylmuramoyl-L-alanine amidase CwlD n=1 Tax=Priestia koreensis TaxID=284581 RepID=UPI001F583367|nr:N-acetylmuramoyl-L-alanine amidase CwlD [Priestia koreensis]MCM3006732.1 N-acetylmuramoyl-L-alanine amidase CwlD [Priestia koreensis]UNL85169.1 N-acetylmuramoyl-L-alanine amidase CwlD [Priestia koreensis]
MKKYKIALVATIVLILLGVMIQHQITQRNSWKSWNLPLSGKIVIIDAGHGGPDGGAVGDEVLEKDVTLKISLMIRDYLQGQGALVMMTRDDDYDLADKQVKGYGRRKVEDLKKRLKLINESSADMYLSIHLNAIPSAKWRGAQTFYHGSLEENKNLAKFIQAEIKDNLKNTDRDAKPIQGIYLLKHAKVPGALVEVGFLSNREERELLQTKKYQRKIAESIYEGVNRYLTEETIK